jgi:hypothetical protein
VREAVRRRLRLEPRPAARLGDAEDLQRRQDLHDLAAQGREVQRRQHLRRGRSQADAAALHDRPEVSPRTGAVHRQVGAGGRPVHRPADPEAGVRSADRHPRRPQRHDPLPQGADQARRQLREPPGVRRPVLVQGAAVRRPDRADQVEVLLRQGQGQAARHQLRGGHPAQRAGGQPALRRRPGGRRRWATRESRSTSPTATAPETRTTTR